MKRTRALALLIVAVVACADSTSTAETTTPDASSTGSEERPTGSYVFYGTPGTEQRPVHVWYHVPDDIGPDAPFVFVMHGASRNGDGYRDAWIDEAERYGFLLVVPQFSDEYYPNSRSYNLGNVFDEDDVAVHEAQWSYAAIEPIFDDARARFGNTSESYVIYGHSAGSQFIHRFVLMQPEARVDYAVFANAGWYTMPTDSVAWPYGIGGLDEQLTGFDGDEALRAALSHPATVLLGTADTLVTDNVRTTPEANAQGRHRFARGHQYFDSAQRAAERLGVEFLWDLRTVEGVGHSNGDMASAAAAAMADHLRW